MILALLELEVRAANVGSMVERFQIMVEQASLAALTQVGLDNRVSRKRITTVMYNFMYNINPMEGDQGPR